MAVYNDIDNSHIMLGDMQNKIHTYDLIYIFKNKQMTLWVRTLMIFFGDKWILVIERGHKSSSRVLVMCYLTTCVVITFIF